MSADHPTVSVEIDFTTNLSAGVGYHEQVLPSGPYAYYRLKETSGTFADASGNAHTGTGAGTITYNQTPAPVTGDATARYVAFTTDTTRIDLTGIKPPAGQITVEAFIYVTSLAVDRFIFENDGAAGSSLIEFWVETDGAVSARGGTGANTVTSAAGAILVNTWYHVAAVFDAPARTISFYKNGTLLFSDEWFTTRGASTSLSSLNTSWHWGTDSSASKGSVARLAEPAVYLRALSAAEITDHYAALSVTPFAGYTFTDVTDKVMFRETFRRSFGRASELDDVVPMQLEFVLQNDDRRFEPEYGDGSVATLAGTPTFNADSSCTINAVADRVQLPASKIDETQCWVAYRLRPNFAFNGDPMGGGLAAIFFVWGTNTDRLAGGYSVSADAWFVQRAATGGAGAEFANEATTESFAAGDERTVIFAFEATRIRVSGQGRAFTNSAAAVDIPTLAATTFDIASDQGNSRHLAGDILWFACGTGTLTDADAATIHALGNTDPNFADLPGTPTALWTAEDASLQPGSPYYPNVVPGRPVRVQMTQDAVTYDWAFGYIEDWPQRWDNAGKFCRVPIRATCFLARLNEEDIGARDFPEQAAGARLTTLLNAAGHPTSMRDIDTGANTLMALVADTQTVGTHARAIARTDRGLFYLDQRGWATLDDGNHRGSDSRSTASQGTLGSIGQAGEIPYSAPEFHAPKDRIRNEISLRRPGGVDQVATDQTSRSRYGKRSFSDEILLTTDAAVATRAAALLAAFKDPHRRIQAITFNPASGSGYWNHSLGVRLSDRYTWIFRPQQGSSVTTAVFVEGVVDDYQDKVYTSKWFLSVV